jgi:membrane protein YqaA with SNARE-associated domain
MMLHAHVRLWIVLQGATSFRLYPLLVAGVALVLTISMSIPFASILIFAVLLRRDRWKEIALLSSIASAAGGVVLYILFHRMGWPYLIEGYPDLVQSKAWIDATRWVTAYGTWALLVVAASPLPQTPALIFTAVSSLALVEVFFALFLGKLVKYSAYAWVAATFPGWFERLIVTRGLKPRDGRLGAGEPLRGVVSSRRR